MQNWAKSNAECCPHRVVLSMCRQHLGLLEVGGVKALGKPLVDGCQQFVGLGVPALLPQAAQAQCRPQLGRCRLLALAVARVYCKAASTAADALWPRVTSSSLRACPKLERYTSYKVANFLVEFSTSIPRTQLRPGYGDGFLGAPLQSVPPRESSSPRMQGGQRGTSRTHRQHNPGGAHHVCTELGEPCLCGAGV